MPLDPELDPLRPDPRIAELLAKSGAEAVTTPGGPRTRAVDLHGVRERGRLDASVRASASQASGQTEVLGWDQHVWCWITYACGGDESILAHARRGPRDRGERTEALVAAIEGRSLTPRILEARASDRVRSATRRAPAARCAGARPLPML